MRLWRMVCALCRELRRLWHEATEATNFFRWISPKAVVLSFPVGTPSHPLFCHVFFFFFSESLLTSQVKTDENLDVSFVFFVDADAKTWGIPQEAGRGQNMLACLCHKYPHFFWKGSFAMKKNTFPRLKIQNAQVCWLKNVDSFCLIFFWWVESCTSKPASYGPKFSRNSMGGNGVLEKNSPDPEASFKRLREIHGFSILHQEMGRGGLTRNKPKKNKCHLNLMLLEQWTKIQVVWDIQGIVLLMCQKSGWRSPPGMYKLFFTM